MDIIIFNIFRKIIAFFVITTLIKNFIFLVISPFYSVVERSRYIKQILRRREIGLLDKYEPRVSVIVPAWNEEVGILKTIKSVIYNGYINFEIIIVNDGSTDNSNSLIKKFIEKIIITQPLLQLRIIYIYQKNSGKGGALNKGLEKANGEIIMTIDADSILKKGAIKNLVKYYMDERIMAVVGNVQITNTNNLISLAQHLEYHFGFYNKRGHALMNAEYIFGGACASFRKIVFEKFGYFDTKNKTEDIEMSMRIKSYGYKCTYAEDVICFTEGASNLKSLIAQRVRWKKGRFDTFWKYKEMFFSTEENHNFFLSFFVLPFSLLTEIQLLFEPIAITILVIYSIITSEFLSLAIGISFIFLVYFATSLFSGNKRRPMTILSFPFTWPLFYFLDWIEFMALWKSIKMIIKSQDVKWQKWQRQGINNKDINRESNI